MYMLHTGFRPEKHTPIRDALRHLLLGAARHMAGENAKIQFSAVAVLGALAAIV